MNAVGDVQSHRPEWGMERRGPVPCMHCDKHTGTHPQVGIGEERWICSIYIVENVGSHMCPVSYGEEKRVCPMDAMGDAQ